MKTPDLRWYTCVHESEGRIVYGRAPRGNSEEILEEIKNGLRFHKLIGLQSKIFLRSSRIHEKTVCEFCEEKADKNSGEYQEFKTVKLDLRWGEGEPAESSSD